MPTIFKTNTEKAENANKSFKKEFKEHRGDVAHGLQKTQEMLLNNLEQKRLAEIKKLKKTQTEARAKLVNDFRVQAVEEYVNKHAPKSEEAAPNIAQAIVDPNAAPAVEDPNAAPAALKPKEKEGASTAKRLLYKARAKLMDDSELLSADQLKAIVAQTELHLKAINELEKKSDGEIAPIKEYLDEIKECAEKQKIAELQRSQPVELMQVNEAQAQALQKLINNHFHNAEYVIVKVPEGAEQGVHSYNIDAKVNNQVYKVQVDGSGFSTTNLDANSADIMALAAKHASPQATSLNVKASTVESQLILAKAVAKQGIGIKNLAELTSEASVATKIQKETFNALNTASIAIAQGQLEVEVPLHLNAAEKMAFAKSVQECGVKVSNIDKPEFKNGIDENALANLKQADDAIQGPQVDHSAQLAG